MVKYKLVLLLAAICTPWLLLAQQTRTLPSGTEINVRADQEITAEAANAGQSYPATVSSAVVDSEGHVLIPKGASATLRAQADGSNVSLDLPLCHDRWQGIPDQHQRIQAWRCGR
jgi:hypothetical protein